jgi:glycosyltransferase involved in cell wall biosynthesis
MNIYINGRFLSQPITGVQRYAIELVKQMDRLIFYGNKEFDGKKFTLLLPGGCINNLELKSIKTKNVGFLKGLLWEQLALPIYASDGLVLNFCNSAPILMLNKIVNICDASVFQYGSGYSFLFRNWYKFLLPILVKTSKKITTISDFSKIEIAKFCNIEPKKIEVVHIGATLLNYSQASLDATNKFSKILDGSYILAVGSLNPNKNLTRKNIIKMWHSVLKLFFSNNK